MSCGRETEESSVILLAERLSTWRLGKTPGLSNNAIEAIWFFPAFSVTNASNPASSEISARRFEEMSRYLTCLYTRIEGKSL